MAGFVAELAYIVISRQSRRRSCWQITIITQSEHSRINTEPEQGPMTIAQLWHKSTFTELTLSRRKIRLSRQSWITNCDPLRLRFTTVSFAAASTIKSCLFPAGDFAQEYSFLISTSAVLHPAACSRGLEQHAQFPIFIQLMRGGGNSTARCVGGRCAVPGDNSSISCACF